MHAGATMFPWTGSPISRIDQILEDADPEYILTQGSLRGKFQEACRAELLYLDEEEWQSSKPAILPEGGIHRIWPSLTSGPPVAQRAFRSGITDSAHSSMRMSMELALPKMIACSPYDVSFDYRSARTISPAHSRRDPLHHFPAKTPWTATP